MPIISDTNILSTFAAGNALHLLAELFPRRTLSIPALVHQELQIGHSKGQTHLNRVLQAIATNHIQQLKLSDEDLQNSQAFPDNLKPRQRELITLAQHYNAPLLSNDKRVARCAQERSIKIIMLTDLLRLLWLARLLTQPEVKELIEEMARVENLTLREEDRDQIFAPRRPRRTRRRRRRF